MSSPASPALPCAFVVGGTGSNAGKTVFTLALLCALAQRGLCPLAAKVGPDYIDTAFHTRITARPAANLDSWMCREAGPGRSWRRPAVGLGRIFQRTLEQVQAFGGPLVIEGAMGLYDGGHEGFGSTAHVATQLGLPVLLLLNAAGLGQSIAALAEGFLGHRPPWAEQALTFLGMVCTHVAGERHAAILRQALLPVADTYRVPLLGMLPRQGAPLLPSRHLGLVEAREALPLITRASLAHWLEEHCQVETLLALLGIEPKASAAPCREACQARTGLDAVFWQNQADIACAHAANQQCMRKGAINEASACASSASADTGAAIEGILCYSGQKPHIVDSLPGKATCADSHFFPPQRVSSRKLPLVGIAWDAAFSFCYADLPALLAEQGARVAFFSPLHDQSPPADCAGLYFPGGYPELHAAALAANAPMLAALRRLAEDGLPMYGECGGYMYLMRAVSVDGQEHALCGLLPYVCALGSTRAALGYRAALALPGWPTKRQDRPLWVRGHEFHYTRAMPDPKASGVMTDDTVAGRPLWKIYDSQGVFLGEEGCRCGSVAGTWLHCYPEGSRRFWKAWLQALSCANCT
ncbi:MAG: cobyrinate a,c-diamide synthase [Desulfovibrio sp.]|nr:cobyrinate a,c-diamide synthase [Desulfovibrio sp.]